MPTLAKHNHPWSKEEVALLKKLYTKKVFHCAIAVQLKRTHGAIKAKIKKLGLAGKK